MQINLTDILSREQKTMDWTATIEMESFVSALGSFPIKEKTPLKLTAVNLGEDRLRLVGDTVLTVVIPCDRCLVDVDTVLEIHIDKEVEIRPADQEGMEELVEKEFIFGYNLDVDELVYSEILVNWPMKTLCKESCKGICRKCGANLNYGTCDCDTEELDPRMAAIRDIFNTVK